MHYTLGVLFVCHGEGWVLTWGVGGCSALRGTSVIPVERGSVSRHGGYIIIMLHMYVMPVVRGCFCINA